MNGGGVVSCIDVDVDVDVDVIPNGTKSDDDDTCTIVPCCKTLTPATCNPYIKTFKAMEYAARGPVILRANQIESQLKLGSIKKPFSSIIKANLGDAHAMGQKPISFIRQVIK